MSFLTAGSEELDVKLHGFLKAINYFKARLGTFLITMNDVDQDDFGTSITSLSNLGNGH